MEVSFSKLQKAKKVFFIVCSKVLQKIINHQQNQIQELQNRIKIIVTIYVSAAIDLSLIPQQKCCFLLCAQILRIQGLNTPYIIKLRQLLMQNNSTQANQVPEIKQNPQEINKSKIIEEKIKESIGLLGSEGKYQTGFIIFFTICFFLATYQFVSSSYYFMNPVFDCDGVSTSEEEACLKLDKCTIVNDYTITAENKLYCDRKDDRNLIQSLYGLGSMLGVVFVNFISDYNGRKFSIILSIAVQVISMILLNLGAAYDVVAVMGISQIFIGFSSGSFISVSYVYTDKIMSKKWSDRSILITNGFGSLAQITLVFFSSYSTWHVLSIYVVMIPSALCLIFAIFFLAQDPILLYSKSDFKECENSLKKMAKINNKLQNLPQALAVVNKLKEDKIVMDGENYSILKKLSYLKILASKKILIPVLLLGFHSFGGNIYYYTLNYSINNIGTSYGFNMILFGIAQFIGIFPLMFIGNKVPRKLGQISIVLTVIGITFLFFIEMSTILQTVLLFTARFILVSQYAIYIYLAVQTFPQHIQSTTFGIIQLFAQTAKLVAPFQINLADALKMSPITTMGMICLVFTLTPLLFIKQTLKPQNKSVKQKTTDSAQETLQSSQDIQKGLIIN